MNGLGCRRRLRSFLKLKPVNKVHVIEMNFTETSIIYTIQVHGDMFRLQIDQLPGTIYPNKTKIEVSYIFKTFSNT